jgi:hypothetical protein
MLTLSEALRHGPGFSRQERVTFSVGSRPLGLTSKEQSGTPFDRYIGERFSKLTEVKMRYRLLLITAGRTPICAILPISAR